MPNDTYQAHVSTPEEDKILNDIGESLAAWLRSRLESGGSKNIYSLALTALMLFTASGAVGASVPREAFIDLMGKYYDMYLAALKKLS